MAASKRNPNPNQPRLKAYSNGDPRVHAGMSSAYIRVTMTEYQEYVTRNDADPYVKARLARCLVNLREELEIRK